MLGDVLKESVEVALAYIKNNQKQFKLTKYEFDKYDYHLNFLNAAIKKDGPSAGVSIVTSLLSLILNKDIPKNIAMTGEISLQGNVYKVGGIKEKIIGAYNLGIKTIFIPKENEYDLIELPFNMVNELKIIKVSNYEEIFKEIFKEK